MSERDEPNPPARVLIASDFHLGSGWDAVTGTCVATENFLADDACTAWLAHHASKAADTLVVFNGDIFDFLRVTEVPSTDAQFERWSSRLADLGEARSAEQLRAAITASERCYGLQTHDYKTVWKLTRIAEGHPGFFRALAQWVADGGRMLFVTGNHDVELYWPLVRAALRWELSQSGAPADLVADNVRFADADVVIDNVYVEHGHQYDGMTRVEGEPTLPPPHQDQINLPLGSFINRYFINRVEALDPFIDNVKPVQQSLLRLARQRPLKILSTYLSGWRFVRRAIAMRRVFNGAVLTIALLLVAPVIAPLLLLTIPGVRNALLGWLQIGDAGESIVGLVSGVAVTGAFPYLLGVVGELFRRRPKDHHLEAAARAVATKLAGSTRGVRYVCMGHTHVSAVKLIDDDDDRLYVNTGTWIALWPRDRPDLLGRRVYTYAQFDVDGDDGYRVAVREWDPHADRPHAATILVPAAA